MKVVGVVIADEDASAARGRPDDPVERTTTARDQRRVAATRAQCRWRVNPQTGHVATFVSVVDDEEAGAAVRAAVGTGGGRGSAAHAAHRHGPTGHRGGGGASHHEFWYWFLLARTIRGRSLRTTRHGGRDCCSAHRTARLSGAGADDGFLCPGRQRGSRIGLDRTDATTGDQGIMPLIPAYSVNRGAAPGRRPHRRGRRPHRRGAARTAGASARTAGAPPAPPGAAHLPGRRRTPGRRPHRRCCRRSSAPSAHRCYPLNSAGALPLCASAPRSAGPLPHAAPAPSCRNFAGAQVPRALDPVFRASALPVPRSAEWGVAAVSAWCLGEEMRAVCRRHAPQRRKLGARVSLCRRHAPERRKLGPGRPFAGATRLSAGSSRTGVRLRRRHAPERRSSACGRSSSELAGARARVAGPRARVAGSSREWLTAAGSRRNVASRGAPIRSGLAPLVALRQHPLRRLTREVHPAPPMIRTMDSPAPATRLSSPSRARRRGSRGRAQARGDRGARCRLDGDPVGDRCVREPPRVTVADGLVGRRRAATVRRPPRAGRPDDRGTRGARATGRRASFGGIDALGLAARHGRRRAPGDVSHPSRART